MSVHDVLDTLTPVDPAGEALFREAADVDLHPDGTVEVLAVPWDRQATIVELVRGRAIQYREQFARGAFDGAVRGPSRIPLTWGHSEAFGDILGRGRTFTDTDEGLVGVFRLVGSEREKAAALIEDMGLSISFRSESPLHGSEQEGQLVTRRRAVLRHVAIVATPAYSETKVLAIRAAAEAELARQAAREADARFLAAQLRTLQSNGHALTRDQSRFLSEHPPA